MGAQLGRERGGDADETEAERADRLKAEEARKKIPKPDPPVSRYGKRRGLKKGVAAPLRLPTVNRLNSRLKLVKLWRIKDWLSLQKEFLARVSGRTRGDAAGEVGAAVDAVRGAPMVLMSLDEFIGDEHGIVTATNGVGEHYCRIHSIVDKEQLEPGATVLVQTKSPPMPELFIVGVLGEEMESQATCLMVDKAPTESFKDIGGLEEQVEQLKETVEMPLLQPELFEEMGITPPKGVILYGPPGTGKTLLAKAVANRTEATFIRVVGSELIQRHSGDGPKLVREIFKLADIHAPSIIFFDEIDAVGTKRYDTTCGGEKEIQRTMLELLNQLDGFANRKDVKIIMATNQIESLDPALIRPGRIDRKIEIPNPGPEQMAKIFRIHTEKMNIAPEARNFDALGWEKKDLSGADIKAVCTEAGMLTLRERRTTVTLDDFCTAVQSLISKKTASGPASMFL